MLVEQVNDGEEAEAKLTDQIFKLSEDLLQVKANIGIYACQLQELNELRIELGNKRQVFRGEQQEILAQKSKVLYAGQRLDSELKELRRKCNEVKNRLHEIQLIEAKYSYEVNYSQEQMQEQFSINIAVARDLLRTGSSEELTGLSKRLERQMAALGAVNPNVIEEYKHTKERADFKNLQLQALAVAKVYLTSLIKDIDRTRSKQFPIAFEIINVYFGDIFSRLFGGSKART